MPISCIPDQIITRNAGYLWQLIENKQKFIGQIMTSKYPVRSSEDIDESALTYAEVKALATGNPYIKEKMDLDVQVSKMKLLKANHPSQIKNLEERIEGYKADIAMYKALKPADKDVFSMTICGITYDERKEAGAALIAFCKDLKQANTEIPVGEYLGMQVSVSFDSFDRKFTLSLKGKISHSVEVGAYLIGNIIRIGNALEGMEAKLADAEQQEHPDATEHEAEVLNASNERKTPAPVPQSAHADESHGVKSLRGRLEEKRAVVDARESFRPKPTQELPKAVNQTL